MHDIDTLVDVEAPEVPKPRPWIIRHWTLPTAVAMLAIAALTLRGHLPSISAVTATLSTADARWIAIAVICEALSNDMFARQQRVLLHAVSVRMSVVRALAVTYVRMALAISMPAGSAVSAGYAFGQYKRSGATTEKATAVMVLSGVVSILGLVALYVAGVLGIVVVEPAQTWHDHGILLIACLATTAVGVATWLGFRRANTIRAAKAPLASKTGAALSPTTPPSRRIDNVRIATRQAIDAWRSLRVRDWSAAGLLAVVNWLTDMLCLVASARAFNLQVGLVTIASIYLGVQLVRQIPITPGGIGLIETGLLAGLVSAGAPTAAAAAAILTYRVLSCWVLLPLGGLAWLGLRARPGRLEPSAASVTLSESGQTAL
jgi:uncharacterized protein (TIRG00374 family)